MPVRAVRKKVSASICHSTIFLVETTSTSETEPTMGGKSTDFEVLSGRVLGLEM